MASSSVSLQENWNLTRCLKLTLNPRSGKIPEFWQGKKKGLTFSTWPYQSIRIAPSSLSAETKQTRTFSCQLLAHCILCTETNWVGSLLSCPPLIFILFDGFTVARPPNPSDNEPKLVAADPKINFEINQRKRNNFLSCQSSPPASEWRADAGTFFMSRPSCV